MKWSLIPVEIYNHGLEYFILVITVSEWLLFNANSAIFQLYHGEDKLIVNEMMMMSALY
jgi:hypothetical protein